MTPLDIIAGPVTALINGVKDLLGKKLQNDGDKIEVALKLGQLQAGLQEALINLDLETAQTQRDVLTAEAKSESWLTRNWRPIVMLAFLGIILWVIFHGAVDLSGRPIPQDYMDYVFSAVKLGLGGYVIGRSAEKIAPVIVGAITKGNGDGSQK